MNNREELARLRAEAEALCLRLERLDAATGEEMTLQEWGERLAAAGVTHCSVVYSRGEWMACGTGDNSGYTWHDSPGEALAQLLREVEG